MGDGILQKYLWLSRITLFAQKIFYVSCYFTQVFQIFHASEICRPPTFDLKIENHPKPIKTPENIEFSDQKK